MNMNGRIIQQPQQSDPFYSPSSTQWMATASTILRSPWSSPSLKQSPHYGGRNRRHSRNRSLSSFRDMEYVDEYSEWQQRPSSHGFTSSSGEFSYYHRYDQEPEHQHGYGNLMHGLDTQSSTQQSRRHILHYQHHQQRLQQQSHDVEQPYSRHRRTSQTSCASRASFSPPSNNHSMKNLDRLMAIENSSIDHHTHHIIPNKGQNHRKLTQQQAPSMLSGDAATNKKLGYRRQEPVHQGHPHYAAGWKMSSQYNHPSPHSSFSPTLPSLYDNNSSSSTTYTTLSSSSSAPAPVLTENNRHHRSNNGMTRSNGATYHRGKHSVDGSNQIIDYPHQQKQSILASSASTTTNSSSLGSANHRHQTISVKPTSANSSISSRHRYSYDNYHDDQLKNPCHNTQVIRTRRYSQGDSGNIKHQTVSSTHQSMTHTPVPRRVSTPKLRRVCSAKPYMEQQPPLSQANDGVDNSNDVDVDDMDAASLSLAQRTLASTGGMNDIEDDDDGDDDGGGSHHLKEQQASPNFWNPRSEKDIIPVKQTLSRRIRGLLLPQRNKSDASMSKDQQLAIDYQWSLARPLTPVNELSFDNDALLEDQENGVVDNPFYIISQSWDIADHFGLSFVEDDFLPVDTYANSIQQVDPSLTLGVLSQQVLTRPYQHDLHRLRTLFTWIIQNIIIADQYKQNTAAGRKFGNVYEGDEAPAPAPASTSTTTGTGSTTTITNTIQSSKVSLRQRLTTRRNVSNIDQEDELEMPAMDVMHGDGLLPEGGGNVDSFDDWLLSESAQQVLLHGKCSSSIGMANLFCEMAKAAGCRDARVVYGYLRAPKDSINTACMDNNIGNNGENISGVDDHDNVTLIQNHAWCCIKVEGEYRFVDCWLASPFQPQNKNKMESHWFLIKPTDLIYTHFSQDAADQCLEPTIDVTTFFALPHVWPSFFLHHIKMIRYNPDSFTLVDDDSVCHLTFRVDPGVVCFAFVETDKFSSKSNSQPSTITMRCLAQSRMIPDEKTGLLERVYKIKAILPPGHDGGWLKIYAGTSSSSSVAHHAIQPLSSSSSSSTTATTTTLTRQDHGSSTKTSSRHSLTNNATTAPSNDPLPPLAVCFRLTTAAQHQDRGTKATRQRPFEFVHLHPCRHEFYIREPQCYLLYPLQTYNFLIRGDDTHHKLAIKSPGGKLYKLMYYPQEHTYDGSVKVSETGKWSLISLLHNSGGWYVVATWECRG